MKAYSFKKFKPTGLRVWHWLNAVVLLGSLATVALRDTFLAVRPNTHLIMQKITEAGGSITEPVAREVAQGLRNQMWTWHFYFGFCLAGLLVLRLLVRVFAEKGPFLSEFLKAWRMSEAPTVSKKKALHYNLVKTGYAAFYLVLIYQVVSGLTMYYGEQLGLSDAVFDAIHEVHELFLWFFVGFIVIHVLGVIFQELLGERGIVSDMIHGGDGEL